MSYPSRSMLCRAAACATLFTLLSTLPISAPQAEPVDALKQARSTFAWEGEELYYKVKVNASDAAHAVIRIGEIRTLKDQPYVPLSAKAHSVGLFESIYPMDDRVNTFVNPLTFKPLRSEKAFKEAGKARTYKVDYDHNGFTAKVFKILHKDDKNPKDREYNLTRPIPGATHDALSWFFDLRAQPSFTTGQILTYYIDDGWKLSRLDLTVAGEERVLTPMGWFNAIRLEVHREDMRAEVTQKDGRAIDPTLSITKPGKSFGSIWLSDDARHLPIKLQVVSPLGTGEVFLAKYIPPKKP